MAGPMQRAMSEAVSTASIVATVGKKAYEDERQAREKASAEAKAEKQAQEAVQKEAEESALEADLIKRGADPESVRGFMTARSLGLSTKGFGMIRGEGGKFAGSYSTIAEKLSKNALADSLSSRVINDQGFAKRLFALAPNRKGRVEALLQASGGKK